MIDTTIRITVEIVAIANALAIGAAILRYRANRPASRIVVAGKAYPREST